MATPTAGTEAGRFKIGYEAEDRASDSEAGDYTSDSEARNFESEERPAPSKVEVGPCPQNCTHEEERES